MSEKSVNPSLYPYQKQGVDFITSRKTTILADEPGLGKTIQAIAAINCLYQQKGYILPTLIVCPSPLKINWFRELQKWLTCNLNIQIVRKGNDFIAIEAQIVIVNYELVTKPTIFNQLFREDWGLIIADECHYLKNFKAKRTKQCLKLMKKKADYKLFISGTPILNRPIELYPILFATAKETIKPYDNFYKYSYRYCNGFIGSWGFDNSGSSNQAELKEKLQQIMIRRLKKDQIKSLPDKILQIIPFARDSKSNRLLKKEARILDKNDLSIIKLQASPKIGNLGELATIRKEIALEKLPKALEFIENALKESKKIVIFAYHREIIKQLKDELYLYDRSVVLGGMSNEDKQQAIDDFQNNPEHRIFIGQINAAGVGITLTTASRVIFVESTWTPSEIDQAIDRCHRIGQKNTVLAQFLVTENSIDEVMLKTILKKNRNISQIID